MFDVNHLWLFYKEFIDQIAIFKRTSMPQSQNGGGRGSWLKPIIVPKTPDKYKEKRLTLSKTMACQTGNCMESAPSNLQFKK